jgi:hypothetical protein
MVMSLFVSACATYEVGEYPLTKAEIANLQNANPNAFTINYINDLEFDVTNTTYEDQDFAGRININRWVQISKEIEKYPIFNILNKKRTELAEKTCQAKDMTVEYKYYRNFSTRYKCISYVERSFESINFDIEQCSKAAQGDEDAVRFLKNLYTSHPCEGVKLDPKYCKTFSELFEIYPGQVVSCQELKQKREKALYKQNVDSMTEHQSPKKSEKSFNFIEAEKKCAELGFKAKSEKFADCVMKLSR